MSDTAAQPWWADVQHLRPREAGGSAPARFGDGDAVHARWDDADHARPEAAVAVELGDAPRSSGRFARTSVVDSPLETAVAVAIADDLPRLHDIEWHDFIDSHQELDDVVGGDLWEEPSKDARPKRRTVEIRGQVDRAATAPVEAEIPTSRRHRAPAPGERFHAHPDRVALWAFLLGVVLMIVAALSAPEADAAVRLVAG
jgi:hypothetical protein